MATQKAGQEEITLCTYLGEYLEVLGSTDIQVNYNSQTSQQSLLVVVRSGLTLLGRNWLCHICLDWQAINQVTPIPVQTVLKRHESVFQGGLGALKGYQAKITVDANATPYFCKSRSVPYACRELVEKELNCLVQEGILEPAQVPRKRACGSM